MIKNKEFHLVVAVNPKAYKSEGGMYAGELAGSVIANCLHIEKAGGVVFHNNLRNTGIAYLEDNDKLDKIVKQFNKTIKINDENIKISQYGFFYEAGTKEIRWIFKANISQGIFYPNSKWTKTSDSITKHTT